MKFIYKYPSLFLIGRNASCALNWTFCSPEIEKYLRTLYHSIKKFIFQSDLLKQWSNQTRHRITFLIWYRLDLMKLILTSLFLFSIGKLDNLLKRHIKIPWYYEISHNLVTSHLSVRTKIMGRIQSLCCACPIKAASSKGLKTTFTSQIQMFVLGSPTFIIVPYLGLYMCLYVHKCVVLCMYNVFLSICMSCEL